MKLPDNEIRLNPGAEAIPKTFGGVNHILAEDHRIWLSAAEYWYAKGRQDASVDLACEWLHAQACEHAGIAQRSAANRHGRDWAETIAQAAEVA